jgi:hypothetical protein
MSVRLTKDEGKKNKDSKKKAVAKATAFKYQIK